MRKTINNNYEKLCKRERLANEPLSGKKLKKEILQEPFK